MTIDFPLKFGDQGQYELSEVAFSHILTGNTVVRPVHTLAGRTREIVLSGGLHTYEGWKAFLSNHPKVVHLLEFKFGVDDAWYFARELQNGVITLKIPRRLFTGDAASITLQPDNYYKSGYLWKTLFPVSYSETDILRSIQEALLNIDKEDSEEPAPDRPMGVLYGYAAVDDPFTAIKIRVQVRGNQILSAFPSWEQPRTGNNGKPYSPEHSIGFQIAESTLDHKMFQSHYGPVFKEDVLDLNALVERTPSFIKSRGAVLAGTSIDDFRSERVQILQQYACRASREDLDKIDDYLADYPCAKDPFRAQQAIYNQCLGLIDRSPEMFSSVQFSENVGECILVLAFCDSIHKTRKAIVAIVRFLAMGIVHAGGLNTLMFKALLGKMITIATQHHDPDALKDTLKALAGSPSRAALYTEFDLNPFVKTNSPDGLAIIGLTSVKTALTVDHLIEFIAFNLGENYLLGFNKEQRLSIASAVVDKQNGRRLSSDVMSRLVGSDFDFFIPGKLEVQRMVGRPGPDESDFISIIRDYGRMLLMLRQRIVIEDTKVYAAEPDYSQAGTQAHFELMKQKHKYAFVRAMHKAMLEDTKKFSDAAGHVRLSEACRKAIERFDTEAIPLPKPIPDYIDSWRQSFARSEPGCNDLASSVLGE